MLIKNFTFTKPPLHPRADGWSYREGEYTSVDGIRGQGGETPKVKTFGNHLILMVDGRFYDPSYGTDHDNRKSWEKASLSGTLARRQDGPLDHNGFIAAKENVDDGADEKDVIFRPRRGNRAEVGN